MDVFSSETIPPNYWLKSVSTSRLHTCVIDQNDDVRCWGENKDGQSSPPPLKNPRQVSTGLFHTCAIDDNGVKCWGHNGYGQTKAPKLSNVKQISTGEYHSCALYDKGLTCWGLIDFKIPPLKNPKLISTYLDNTCVVDDEGSKCWRGDFALPTKKNLGNVTEISVGSDTACAIRNDNVLCWSLYTDNQNLNTPKFKKPNQISVGSETKCVIDDEGLKCWNGCSNIIGSKCDLIDFSENFLNPRFVNVFENTICVIDDLAVRCVGRSDNFHGQTNIDFLLSFGYNFFAFKKASKPTLDYYNKMVDLRTRITNTFGKFYLPKFINDYYWRQFVFKMVMKFNPDFLNNQQIERTRYELKYLENICLIPGDMKPIPKCGITDQLTVAKHSLISLIYASLPFIVKNPIYKSMDEDYIIHTKFSELIPAINNYNRMDSKSKKTLEKEYESFRLENREFLSKFEETKNLFDMMDYSLSEIIK